MPVIEHRGSDCRFICSLAGRAVSVVLNEITDYKTLFVKLSSGASRQCKICGKVVNNMKNHYLYHNPGRYECPVCLRTFSRPDHLKQHMKWKHAHIPLWNFMRNPAQALDHLPHGLV